MSSSNFCLSYVIPVDLLQPVFCDFIATPLQAKQSSVHLIFFLPSFG